MWFLYIIECENGAYYTGVTQDLERRLREHCGMNARNYTNYNRPKRILYSEEYGERSEAERRERQIKRWSRHKKEALIYADLLRLKELSRSQS